MELFPNISDENIYNVCNNAYIGLLFCEYRDLLSLKINIDLGFNLVNINLSGQ